MLTPTDIEVARLYLRAFDDDSIKTWIAATNAWNDRPYQGRIGRAVQNLRERWYHDGSGHATALCKAAADSLRLALEQTP
jgi:hypothetical protein